jgi:hypothetical protein
LTQVTDEEWKELDLSALSYQQFLAFFFDRPIVGDKDEHDLFGSGVDSFVVSNPTTVVAHLQAMCRNFSEVTKVYSHEQLNQGLWAVFGAASCERFLFDPAVHLGLRVDCVESMYVPFRDVVASSAINEAESFYFMWWDMILHTFWGMADKFDYASLSGGSKQIVETMYQRALEFDYAGLSEEDKQILVAVYRTLRRILAIDDRGCQWSALHGLGHLHHPLVHETVQNYLDAHRDELTNEDVQWIEGCRDGQIA